MTKKPGAIRLLASLHAIGNTASAQSNAWVTVENAQGQSVMGFRPADKPFKAGMAPAVSEHFVKDSGVRDRQGRVISGFGL